jgi:hypothetical protein
VRRVRSALSGRTFTHRYNPTVRMTV